MNTHDLDALEGRADESGSPTYYIVAALCAVARELRRINVRLEQLADQR